MLILFLVISTSFSSMKFLTILSTKKAIYEDKYITIINLKEKLASTICRTSLKEEDDFSGVHFTTKCEKLKELKSFQKGVEDEDTGNVGNYLITLYKVQLSLKNEVIQIDLDYYITVSEKI